VPGGLSADLRLYMPPLAIGEVPRDGRGAPHRKGGIFSTIDRHHARARGHALALVVTTKHGLVQQLYSVVAVCSVARVRGKSGAANGNYGAWATCHRCGRDPAHRRTAKGPPHGHGPQHRVRQLVSGKLVKA
jgi:hypothetical protein